MLELDGKGLSLVDMDRHREHFRTGLNGAIRMEYADKNTIIRLYLLPQKFVRPTIISPKDDAIGPISLRQLINLLVIGATGTGKTVVIKIILAKISKLENATVWLLDFKKLDFQEFANSPHYFGYTDCLQGLKDYYAVFKAQQEAGIVGAPNYLVIDEWGSFIMSLPRPEAEKAKSLLVELIMLGRGYNFYPIVGIQRPMPHISTEDETIFNAVLRLAISARRGGAWYSPTAGRQKSRTAKSEKAIYI